MRIVCLVACAALAASSGSAMAAGCNKGMLWPFVRAAGDCLTDAEIAAGQTGVYNGPTTTNVDVSAIKPDPALQNNAVSSTSTTSGNGWFEGSLFGGSFFSGGLLGGDEEFKATRPGEVACTKGLLWPFARDPGDCLTDKEKKEGHTGVYRADAVVTPASATTATLPQPNGTTAAPPATSATPAATPAVAASPGCNKGWLWPFVKSAGDCLTDQEKKDGRSGGTVATQVNATPAATTPPSGTVAPAAMPAPSVTASAPPAATPAPAAAPACNKGLLWPFVRSAGDCLTDTEKKEGLVATPVNATAAGAPQAAETNAPATMPMPSAAPACHKGLLWPFVKNEGDCPSDADKR